MNPNVTISGGLTTSISDTLRGNLILMSDGLLAPIDLRIQKLSGSLLDIVNSLTAVP